MQIGCRLIGKRSSGDDKRTSIVWTPCSDTRKHAIAVAPSSCAISVTLKCVRFVMRATDASERPLPSLNAPLREQTRGGPALDEPK